MQILMLDLSHILAASDDGFGKVIGAVIFIAIWAIGALVSALGKKREKERQEQLRREVEKAQQSAPNWGTVAGQPPPPPPPVSYPPVPPRSSTVPPQRTPAPAQRQQPPARKPPKPPRPPKQPKQKRPPPPVVVPDAYEEPTTHRTVPETAAPPSRKPNTVNAAALSGWLRPRTLREQFMLTEVLQPPLALRPPNPLQ